VIVEQRQIKGEEEAELLTFRVVVAIRGSVEQKKSNSISLNREHCFSPSKASVGFVCEMWRHECKLRRSRQPPECLAERVKGLLDLGDLDFPALEETG